MEDPYRESTCLTLATAILNCAFDPNKPDEVQKAKETISDMLKCGYAIFVRQGTETF